MADLKDSQAGFSTSQRGLCRYCENVVDRATCGQTHVSEQQSQGIWRWQNPTLKDVRDAAAGGCQSCDMLYNIVQDFELAASVRPGYKSTEAALKAEVLVRLKETSFDRPDALILLLAFRSWDGYKRSSLIEIGYPAQGGSMNLVEQG